MKIKLVVTATVALFGVAFSEQRAYCQHAVHPQKWAVIVGSSNVAGHPELALHYPAKDAKDLHNLLLNEGHFDKDHVRLLLDNDATKEHILTEIGNVTRTAKPDDLIVLYLNMLSSDSCLLPYDGNQHMDLSKGITIHELAKLIKGQPAVMRTLLIVDASHFDARKTANEADCIVISASEPKQGSFESKMYANGIFTHHLVLNLEKFASAGSMLKLFPVVRDAVGREVGTSYAADQTPVFASAPGKPDLNIMAP